MSGAELIEGTKPDFQVLKRDKMQAMKAERVEGPS